MRTITRIGLAPLLSIIALHGSGLANILAEGATERVTATASRHQFVVDLSTGYFNGGDQKGDVRDELHRVHEALALRYRYQWFLANFGVGLQQVWLSGSDLNAGLLHAQASSLANLTLAGGIGGVAEWKWFRFSLASGVELAPWKKPLRLQDVNTPTLEAYPELKPLVMEGVEVTYGEWYFWRNRLILGVFGRSFAFHLAGEYDYFHVDVEVVPTAQWLAPYADRMDRKPISRHKPALSLGGSFALSGQFALEFEGILGPDGGMFIWGAEVRTAYRF